MLNYLNHKGTVILTTPRLILRRFTVDDAQAMYNNWATDEKVTRFLAWEIHESIEKTREILTQWVDEYDSLEYYHWGIEYMHDGNIMIIGGINLHGVSNKSWRAELGYNIGSKWWNKGIMTEAAKAVLEFGFNEVGFNKICALHDTENVGSGRVMQKIGMIREGHFHKHSRRKDGSWGDIGFYSILKENWDNK
ncbi:MAG: GNAT family N-acetyltransferase [Oscillospiraceae bacterium]|nr:GNAT family N-acetyltransferase [Oscillospiraceae bacterium]